MASSGLRLRVGTALQKRLGRNQPVLAQREMGIERLMRQAPGIRRRGVHQLIDS